MSIDTTFHPVTETYAVGNAAAVQIPNAAGRGVTTFRIRNIAPSNATVAYITWAPTAAQALAQAAALPALGAPSIIFGVAGNVTTAIEVPANSFFASNVPFVAATTGFEITGGIGGTGA